jgi:hypothetical protein
MSVRRGVNTQTVVREQDRVLKPDVKGGSLGPPIKVIEEKAKAWLLELECGTRPVFGPPLKRG